MEVCPIMICGTFLDIPCLRVTVCTQVCFELCNDHIILVHLRR